ncbi:ricin B, lectin domain, Glycoside hydrolase, family 5 [Artemisia annua]|uniref:Ricin B, lectin domain, Glycoside hydrolase, family 5 n=1 Tax=Artemisia annua TaxID=35608 RepID=A0A2U1PWN9_ARTAN|nr:ricin B, lectin domain, Glycoside hydrolase, family 5 [Artemisia annua]
MFSRLAYVVLIFFFVFHCHSYPLSTSSRWIVEQSSGNRVKLACVNWPGHLHVMIPEGLNKRPIKAIVSDISNVMGFNCVRLTWATYMYTRYLNVTVSQSLDQWNLTVTKDGITRYNPEVLGLTVVEAQNAVIDELAKEDIMVVLDNHVSLPKWCCSNDDGNAFFGDEFFDPDEWVQGLVAVASRYKGNPTVVAMSMRNELRGPHQEISIWYNYMQQGAVAIHNTNPEILVILSGLDYDSNLGFLKDKPLSINLDSKLVFESHWYPFGQSNEKWVAQTNEYCGEVTKTFMDNSGFLFLAEKNPVPLFLSEFGIDQRGGDEMLNRYFLCLLATVAEHDIDWGLWHLAGSFMLREGQFDVEDVYGMYDFMWVNIRNSTVLERLQFIQTNIQGYNESRNPAYYFLYHPLSGLCINASGDSLLMIDCQHASKWNHDHDGGSIQLVNTPQCLTTTIEGQTPVITDQVNCSSPQSLWNVASGSRHHLASKDVEGNNLCLEVDIPSLNIATNKCLCLDDDLNDIPSCGYNPTRQWLKLIPTNIPI